ncbi:hypothetical protein [Butyrivibrio sp. LC3010]|uniref:hypothetical protein n=1 Tax=Butyrivibrio sp. LC3010 TaxID=1280680 RepID=UPI000478BD47|nr:hypothetical protein [Butyrivibrio sp. LC3010]
MMDVLQAVKWHHVCQQADVGAVAISVGMSFGAFLITFAAVAVGMALEGIGDKIGEIIAS